MSLGLPVFDRKNLKRAYYYFIASNVLITIASIVVVGIADDFIDRVMLDRSTTRILIVFLFLITIIYSSQRRKELKAILEINDHEEQFLRYEKYYIKKCIWNAFSIFLSGVFFAITNKNLFFYMLLIQLGFSILLFPYKRTLSGELKNAEIEYI